MKIAVDFDGTLCENAFPYIGEPDVALIRMLNLAQEDGHKIILWTCRDGDLLEEAIDWCDEHGLVFDAVNKNIPPVRQGTGRSKIVADVYIDDRATKPYEILTEGIHAIERVCVS